MYGQVYIHYIIIIIHVVHVHVHVDTEVLPKANAFHKVPCMYQQNREHSYYAILIHTVYCRLGREKLRQQSMVYNIM